MLNPTLDEDDLERQYAADQRLRINDFLAQALRAHDGRIRTRARRRHHYHHDDVDHQHYLDEHDFDDLHVDDVHDSALRSGRCRL